MMDLESFLESQADNVTNDNTSTQASTLSASSSPDTEPALTFADKLDLSQDHTYRVDKSARRFSYSLERRYVDASNTRNSSNAEQQQQSNLERLQSFTFKRRAIHRTKSGPLETKIHATPLSNKRKWKRISGREDDDDDSTKDASSAHQSRDPRFFAAPAGDKGTRAEESGWKLRNAYKFLDDIIDRDIGMIKETIDSTKAAIRDTKKKTKGEVYSKEVDYEIKRKSMVVSTLKDELIGLRNRKQKIDERDLEQQSKSKMRKLEIEQVKQGVKTAYHHHLKRNRFGQVKMASNTGWNRGSRGGDGRQNIQTVYMQNKFDKLKSEGRLDKYMKKKSKRIHQKFRSALQKKSGAGWNDNA